jgi:predicted secreted protein
VARWVVGVTVVLVLLGVASAAASPPRTITERDSGRTLVVRRGAEVALRLSGPWVWGQARTRSTSVHLTPVEYFRYPGYQEWTVRLIRRGRATITVTGRRPNAPTRRFRVTLLIRNA